MPHSKLLLFSLFVIFSFSVFAQNFSEMHKKILESIEKRDYQTASNELKNLKKTDEKLFTVNNFDYLTARIAEKQSNFAEAMANYQAVAKRNSILKEYALLHLAEISRSSGNLMLERMYLQQISALAPENLLFEAAETRIARSFFESKDYETAIKLLNQKSEVKIQNPKSKIQNFTLARENLFFLSLAYVETKNFVRARQIFQQLIDDLPNPSQPDDFALAGVRGLDELDQSVENAAELSEAELFKRAEIYQFNWDFPAARRHYLELVERFPKSSRTSVAMYQIGRGFVRERNFSKAADWFERVTAEFPDNPIAEDALSQAASAYARLNKIHEAISRYQKFIEIYPDSDKLERAFLNIVDVKRDHGEDTAALGWTEKTQAAFKGNLPEAIALFAQTRIHISQGDWQNALNDLNTLQNFSNLGGTRVSGGATQEEIAFLKGFVLEKLGRFDEASNIYLSIPDGRARYYGWRATERLGKLADDEKAKQIIKRKYKQFLAQGKQNITKENADSVRQSAQNALRLLSDSVNINESVGANEAKKKTLLDILRKTYALLPAYQNTPNFKLLEFGKKEIRKEKSEVSDNYHKNLADELLFLGLYDEATPELEESFKSKVQSPKSENQANLNFTLAVFYKRGDMANRAVGFIEPLWRKIPEDYQIELIPREQIELLYPAPYADSLVKFAEPRNVDPRFVLSIMRQESRFQADIKSFAAARGLMQFVSRTSNQIAGELGRENFKQNELYYPPTAILLGSQYLSNLFKIFPNQPQAVAASYNGGEDNMERWLARSESDDADVYVSEILYPQSKDYVFKVMQNYRIYQMIYDEAVNRK